jgi:SAM-dependent methyltransferase
MMAPAWQRLRWRAKAGLDPVGRPGIILGLPRSASVLDVGCGNRSASAIKRVRNDLKYFGLDIQDYMITDEDTSVMEAYVVCPPEQFAGGILSFRREFDLVLSSHNLEHCYEPDKVLEAMMQVVRPGGCLYLAFPSEASLRLPSRDGCLNFHDDPTHRNVLCYDQVIGDLLARNFKIVHAVRRNRGRMGLGWWIGAMQEPWSRFSGRVRSYTWYFWGFESVIIVKKERMARDEPSLRRA